MEREVEEFYMQMQQSMPHGYGDPYRRSRGRDWCRIGAVLASIVMIIYLAILLLGSDRYQLLYQSPITFSNLWSSAIWLLVRIGTETRQLLPVFLFMSMTAIALVLVLLFTPLVRVLRTFGRTLSRTLLRGGGKVVTAFAAAAASYARFRSRGQEAVAEAAAARLLMDEAEREASRAASGRARGGGGGSTRRRPAGAKAAPEARAAADKARLAKDGAELRRMEGPPETGTRKKGGGMEAKGSAYADARGKVTGQGHGRTSGEAEARAAEDARAKAEAEAQAKAEAEARAVEARVRALAQAEVADGYDDDENEGLCIICFVHERTHALSCGHFKFCDGCSAVALSSGNCPMCRQPITTRLKVFS